MNESQINSFIKKAYPGDIPVSITYINDDSDIGFFGYAKSAFLDNIPCWHEITLNQFCMGMPQVAYNRYRRLKAVLLHEVGHLARCERCETAASIRELKTQLWAIDRAKELKMTDIAKELVVMLLQWDDYEWHGPWRVYRMAYNLAMSDSSLVKKYGLRG